MGARPLALLLAIAVVPLVGEVRDLRAFYQERCAVCHGPDGAGRGPHGARLGGRNLVDPRWLAKQEEADLLGAILNGKGAMPGFRRQLSEAEARRLLLSLARPQEAKRRP
jgi:mono/diheme cytochrome c family protein